MRVSRLSMSPMGYIEQLKSDAEHVLSLKVFKSIEWSQETIQHDRNW
jgi:hypothetical protein